MKISKKYYGKLLKRSMIFALMGILFMSFLYQLSRMVATDAFSCIFDTDNEYIITITGLVFTGLFFILAGKSIFSIPGMSKFK